MEFGKEAGTLGLKGYKILMRLLAESTYKVINKKED